ncbi:MAG: hypothetical protein J2P35_19455, partial [Actinobacteria bacterium]|nr:hypothetical protein [Actinomycetota bacterium]
TVDAGVEFAAEIGLEPVVTAGQGEKARPAVRHPVGFSATPASYPLPPPALDEHGEQIRGWLSAPPAPLPPVPGAGQADAGQAGAGQAQAGQAGAAR